MSWELQINGVRFIGIQTAQFEQSPRRDDSGTDVWFDDFTIGVSSIANVAVFTAANQRLGIIGNRVQGGSAAQICKNLQSRMEDRKSFKLIQDGVVMVESDATTDADNGPRFLNASFVPMGANSFRVNILIKASRVSCSDTPSAVLGNRWQVIDDIDEQWRTTRTWRGKLRVCNAIHNPQAFRHLVIPQLSDGFRRVKMHFTGELNGLELGYEVTDRQLLGDAPPGIAISMNGTHTETLNRNGASSIGEVYVRLDGRPGTDKQVMIEQCMRIINSKVQADKFAVQAENWVWQELIITDFFGPEVCAVDARARVMRSINKDFDNASLRLGNMLLETLGRPLDLGGNYNRFKMIPPDAYPCTTIGLFACHLQSPCVDDHGMPQVSAQIDADGGSPGESSEEQSYPTYDPDGTPLEIQSPGYSDDHTTAMYTHCNVEWIVDIDEGTIQLPLGDLQPASDATSAVVRLHAPTAKLLMKVAAERIGDWPKVPDRKNFTDAAGIRYIPLKYKPNFRPPEYQGDGRKLHVIDIAAEFAMSRAPGPNEFVVPSLPWDDLEGGMVSSDAFTPLG